MNEENVGNLNCKTTSKWYFVSKIVLSPDVQKDSSDREILLQIRNQRPRIETNCEITRIIYLNIERFFSLSLEASTI